MVLYIFIIAALLEVLHTGVHQKNITCQNRRKPLKKQRGVLLKLHHEKGLFVEGESLRLWCFHASRSTHPNTHENWANILLLLSSLSWTFGLVFLSCWYKSKTHLYTKLPCFIWNMKLLPTDVQSIPSLVFACFCTINVYKSSLPGTLEYHGCCTSWAWPCRISALPSSRRYTATFNCSTGLSSHFCLSDNSASMARLGRAMLEPKTAWCNNNGNGTFNKSTGVCVNSTGSSSFQKCLLSHRCTTTVGLQIQLQHLPSHLLLETSIKVEHCKPGPLCNSHWAQNLSERFRGLPAKTTKCLFCGNTFLWSHRTIVVFSFVAEWCWMLSHMGLRMFLDNVQSVSIFSITISPWKGQW